MKRLNPQRPILYPKHFNTYAQCPERYFHERVERRQKSLLASSSPHWPVESPHTKSLVRLPPSTKRTFGSMVCQPCQVIS